MKVLVATDGSEAAIAAAQEALALLRPGAEVVLAVVIPEQEDPMAAAGGFEGPVITEEEAEEEHEQATAHGLEALGETARAVAAAAAALGNRVDVRLVESQDDAGRSIVDVAGEVGADLVVVGASGKGLLRRLFSGSVSDHVVHHAPCPVLVVRHRDEG